MTQERRYSVRVHLMPLPCSYKVPGRAGDKSSYFATVKDISLTGVRLQMFNPVSLGGVLTVSLTLPGYRTIEVVVIPNRIFQSKKAGEYEISGRFLALSDDAKDVISRFYAAQVSREKKEPGSM